VRATRALTVWQFWRCLLPNDDTDAAPADRSYTQLGDGADVHQATPVIALMAVPPRR